LGGAGFLGACIAKELNRKEVFKVSYADVVKNPTLEINFIPIDLLELKSLERLTKFDIIINCTGQITNPFNKCFLLNTDGIINLTKIIDNCSSRIIQISTTAVYGSGKSCNETSPLNPETNYASVKAVAEFLLKVNLDPSRLVILRLTNLYGPKQKKGLAAYILRSYLSDRSLSFNNDGKLIRSFLHVKDAARVISKFSEESNLSGIYNIKGPDTDSIKNLISSFEKEFQVEFAKKFSKIKPWENIDNLSDSKLNTDLKIKYRNNIMTYFKKMIESPQNG
tara:strand:+ start:3222 stop:4061 length:840 start_codon:yes stop_codon:yes gene_type:complete